MSSITRMTTGAALALALLAAPAAFAGERTSQSRDEAAAPCPCAAQHHGAPEAEQKPRTARPSTPEAPVFTDQG